MTQANQQIEQMKKIKKKNSLHQIRNAPNKSKDI